MKYLGPWMVALLVVGAACGEGENDSSIYSSGSSVATFDAGDDADEVGESAESTDAGETATTTDSGETTTTSAGETTTDSGETTTTTTTTDEGNGMCGNGTIDGGEQCDGADLAGASCISLGFTGGELACDPTICVLDVTGCTNDDGGANQCDNFCGGCTCPSDECTICCAQMDKVDACGGGMCSCF